MASTRRKSAAIALAVVGIAGLSLASAAQLTVNAGSLGAGTATIDAACDTDGVDVAFTTAFNATSGAYDVDGITVSDIAGACVDQELRITVIDTTSDPEVTILADESWIVDDVENTFDVTNTPAVNDFDIAIVISG